MANGKEMTFEEGIMELEKTVDALETGNLPLEESISVYENGMKLCKMCSEIIENCQQRIVKINLENGGEENFDGKQD